MKMYEIKIRYVYEVARSDGDMEGEWNPITETKILSLKSIEAANDISELILPTEKYSSDGIFFDKIRYGLERFTFRLITCNLFSGINDRYNKEIYEGDIVKKFINLDGSESFGDNSERREILCTIEYQAPSFIFNTKSYWLPINSGCEIIGNIYENPELLEAKINNGM